MRTDAQKSARRRAAIAAIAIAVAIAMATVILLPGTAWFRRSVPTVGVSPVASADSTAAPATPAPATAPAPTGASATPAPTPAFDADGVPILHDGQPVLRGRSIVARARAGDPSAFLVAGWATNDPQPTCAPSPVHCGSTSLVDAPESRWSGEITLDGPAGQQYGFRAPWAGGFHVLRVRAACTYWASVCLVVDEEIPPPGAVSPDPAARDPAGVPTVVDGQPVYRGAAILDGIRKGWYAQPFYVAGRPEPHEAAGREICTDPVTWDERRCPVVELKDPSSGAGSGGRGPTIVAHGTSEAEALSWSEPAWPGGFVVLRVFGSSSVEAVRLHVVGAVLPPGAARPSIPTVARTFSSMAYNARVVEIEQEPVRWGRQITRYLATDPGSAFLVTGAVRSRACPACPGGPHPVLVEPPVKGSKSYGTAFPLLRPDGSWFVAGRKMIWNTEIKGVVVLVVRQFTGVCPAGAACTGALVVEEVVVPPDS